jgi:hypothetical protein
VDAASWTYEVAFLSLETAAAAEASLAEAGFIVSRQPGTASPVTLTASMAGDEDRVDHALDKALAGIEHDPEMIWQAARLTEIYRPERLD